MKVQFTASALRRLQQIRDYYRKNGNPTKGGKITKQVFKQSKLLKDNPDMGQEEEYLKPLKQGHRYLLVDKMYKLIYLVAKPIIYITDVFDTRQDQEKMKP